MKKNSKIYIAGHSGMLGTAMTRRLKADGYTNIVTRKHSELDLTRQADVDSFFSVEKPEFVFLFAARVGGIADSLQHQADAFTINTQIAVNVISAASNSGVEKLLFTASSAVYPDGIPQPITEDMLLSGTGSRNLGGYAFSKIVGLKLCEYYCKQYSDDFKAVIVPNLYGPNDRGSTVMPMLFRKFSHAKMAGEDSVSVWGTGGARREFLHVDDLVDALLYLVNNNMDETYINIGSGVDISIKELSLLIKKAFGYSGEIIFDTSKPEGVMQKLLDSTKIKAMGWMPKISLQEGISILVKEYSGEPKRAN